MRSQVLWTIASLPLQVHQRQYSKFKSYSDPLLLTPNIPVAYPAVAAGH